MAIVAISTAASALPSVSAGDPSTISPRTLFLSGSSSRFALSIDTPARFSISALSSFSSRRTGARCQAVQQKQQAVVIPEEERWMYDESQIKGPDIWNKTWYPKAADHVTTAKTWYIVDAADKILGRLASTIAIHMRGKNLATYTPSVDMGAFVIVINAEKVAVSGKKRTQKLYRRHSGRPGGMKEETFDQLQQRIPERIIEHAVRGMLPKGRLGRRLFTHLKVYKGPEHPHEAQQPVPLPIRDKRIQAEN